MANLSSYQNREWLVQVRNLFCENHFEFSSRLGMAHVTYLNVEKGIRSASKGATPRAIRRVAEGLGLKTEIFYYPTDEEGRLTSTESILDIFGAFTILGYKAFIHSEPAIRQIFSPDVADYIVNHIISDN